MKRILAIAALASPSVHAAPAITGTWRNPAASVEVAMAPCGPRLCGTVVWASDRAKDDAANGGTDRLIGTQLFRGLQADGPGRWSGEVFVPDLGRTVAGTLELVSAQTLEVAGCVIPGIVCQTQTWTKVAGRRAGSREY